MIEDDGSKINADETSISFPDDDVLPSDKAFPKKILSTMHRLAGELREIIAVTAPNKDYKSFKDQMNEDDNPVKQAVGHHLAPLADVGEDPSVMESKTLDAASHRAASALLEIYEKLGPAELAMAVAEIRAIDPQNPYSIKGFTQGAADIMESYYSRTIFPPKFGEEKRASNHPARNRRARNEPDESSILRRSNAFFLGAAIAGSSLLFSAKGYRDHHMARADLKNSIKETIELRSGKKALTPEQTRRLMELQEIEIPEIREQVTATTPAFPFAGVAAGVLVALLGSVRRPDPAGSLKEYFAEAVGVKNKPRRDLTTTLGTIATIDMVIADACSRGRPPIQGADLPTR